MREALQAAIDAIGGVRATARALNVSPSAINYWKRRRTPAERAIALEQACGAKVTRYELRPDVFGER